MEKIEKKRARKKIKARGIDTCLKYVCIYIWVCVCVCARERERERHTEMKRSRGKFGENGREVRFDKFLQLWKFFYAKEFARQISVLKGERG